MDWSQHGTNAGEASHMIRLTHVCSSLYDHHHRRLLHHFHCVLTFCNTGIYKPAEQWQLEDQMPPTKKRHGSMVFTLKEMEEATCSFSDENLVGKGGFGRVYKGTLRSGEVHQGNVCQSFLLQLFWATSYLSGR